MQASRDVAAVKTVDAELVYLGYGRHSAALNMAMDEAMMRRAEQERKFFLRLYDFTSPCIILANSDSAKNIKAMVPGMEFTRRISAGKPIYIDDNVLSYSIAGPAGFGFSDNQTSIHNYLGAATAEALEATIGHGHTMVLGQAPAGRIPFSIRADGAEPIAGHGQHISSGRSFLYHGVIAVGRWDADAINAAIQLKEDHYERLKTLPCVAGLAGNGFSVQEYKLMLERNMLRAFGRRFAAECDASAEERSAILSYARSALSSGSGTREHGYASREWLFRKDIALREDSSFCLLYEG